MITEDYVSFEVAKLLKDKGFNEKLLTFYITDEAKKEGCFQIMAFADDKIDNNHSDHCYLAPTLQMAMKWLREVHNIKVNIFYNNSNYTIEYFEPNTQTRVGKFVFIGDGYHVYEDACEAAIKYCLENLIK